MPPTLTPRTAARSRPQEGAWLGASEMAERVRAFDWAATPIGPLGRWPASLRLAAATCLRSGFAIAVYWGPELTFLYNDAYREVLGALHPGALGLPARVHLDDTPEVLARLESVFATGESTWTEDELLVFDHAGTPVIRFSTYSYSPIADERGGVRGVLLICQDTTARVTSHRRAALLGRLASRSIGAASEGEMCLRAAETLENSLDVPRVVILLAGPGGAQMVCAASSGAPDRGWAPRREIALDDPHDPAAAILRRALDDSTTGRLTELGPFCERGAEQAPAWLAPLRRGPDEPPGGFLLAGINRRLALDAPYKAFLGAMANQLSRAIDTAHGRDVDRRTPRAPMLHALLVDELRASQRRITAAGDKARRRIERDLHDGAQQRLVALQLELSLLDEQIEADPDAARTVLSRLRRDLDDALTDLRDLAHGVYPALLESDGLVAAVSAAARRSPIAVSVTATAVGTLPRGVEAAVYFCCLEALQNVAKHACATRASVRLEIVGGALHFSVDDDGIGFRPGPAGRGHGLVYLHDRVAALGGTADVRSEPGRGTSVHACLPLG